MTATVRTSARVSALVSVLTFLALLAIFASRASVASAATWSPSSYNSRLLQLVNNARAQHGLPTLRYASGIGSVASSWTGHLAAARSLSHNPNIVSDVQHHGSANATVVAENVGDGATNDPDGLFTAYMNSSEHRANILDSEMRYIGIAVDFSGGYAWNTMDFVDKYGSTATASTYHSTSRSVSRSSSTTHRSTTHHATSAPAHRAAKPAARPARPAARPAPARPQPVATQAARAALADVQLASASLPNTAAQGALTDGTQHSQQIPPLLFAVALALIGGLGTAHLLLRRGFSLR
jgi:uncharacterized protein YkwD